MIARLLGSCRTADELRDAPDSVLDDIGVSRAQLELPLGTERSARWARMAQETGADTQALVDDLDLLREVATRCAGCGDHRSCRRWLADEERDPAAYQAFCPNHAVLDDLPRDPAARVRRAAPPRERAPDLGCLTQVHPGFRDRGGDRR